MLKGNVLVQVVYTHYSTAAPNVAGDNVEAVWVSTAVHVLLPLHLLSVCFTRCQTESAPMAASGPLTKAD